MPHQDPSPWRHEHRFTTGSPVGERRTLLVTGLSAVMMVLEIVAGHFMNSMALFADGWHMGTHGRLPRADREPVERLSAARRSPPPRPRPRTRPRARPGPQPARRLRSRAGRRGDLRGRHRGADPGQALRLVVAGPGGRASSARWSWRSGPTGLIRDAGRVLLDREMEPAAVAEIREAVESDGDSRLSDLHLLRVGLHEFAVVLSVVTDEAHDPEDYKARLRMHEELAHAAVEVNRCRDEHAVGAGMSTSP